MRSPKVKLGRPQAENQVFWLIKAFVPKSFQNLLNVRKSFQNGKIWVHVPKSFHFFERSFWKDLGPPTVSDVFNVPT